MKDKGFGPNDYEDLLKLQSGSLRITVVRTPSQVTTPRTDLEESLGRASAELGGGDIDHTLWALQEGANRTSPRPSHY